MFFNTVEYIAKCKALGVLTDEKIRKYPLRAANLAMVLKAYAVDTNQAYTLNNLKYDEVFSEYELYLTEGGLEWIFDFFKRHGLAFLRTVFQFMFANATDFEVQHPETYAGFNNLRGTVGDKQKAGTKQAAILERLVGRVKKQYHFTTLREAREEFFRLSRYYPIEEFTLYRIRKLTKNGRETHYKEKVPLLLPESRRGRVVNLPNVRRDT